MSGGSLDYIYSRVEDAATTVRQYARSPKHRAFAAHLSKVAHALHDFEWAASGDTDFGDEEEAIDAILSPLDVLRTCLEEAVEAKTQLEIAIKRVKEQA